MNAIRELQSWFLSQCDRDWEHGYGVKISTLDNPGWSVSIELADTDLEEVEFEEIKRGVGVDAREGDDDWLICKVADQKFEGCGGPETLEEILSIFLRWKDAHPATAANGSKPPRLS